MALIDEARRRGLLDPAPAAPPQYGPGLAAYAMAQRPAYRTGGLIEGPGTGTSDSIPAEVPEGTYILPADTTRAAGLASRASEPVLPVALSDGEFEITPEQLQSIGAAVLDILRGVTHTPVEPEPAVVEEQGYANGGEVTRIGSSYSGGNVTGDIAVNGQAPGGTFSQVAGGTPGAMQAPSTPTASVASNAQSGTAVAAAPSGTANPAVGGAPAPAMGWAERNAQRSLEVSASSIKPSAERDFAQSRLAAMSQPSMTAVPNPAAPAVGAPTAPVANPLASTLPQPMAQQRAPLGAPSSFATRQRFANGGMVTDEERRQALISQIPAGAPTPFSAPPAVDPGAGQLSRAVSGPSTSLAAAGLAPTAPAGAPAAMAQAPASSSLASAAGVPALNAAPTPAPSPSFSNPLLDAATQRNNGMISAGNEAAAADMSQRQGLAAYASAQPPQAPSGQSPQVPIVRNSSNDWAARKELENARTSAMSITANGGKFDRNGGISPQRAEYLAMLKTDQDLRASVPGLELQGMREQGDTQRAGLQVAAASANAAADRQGAMDRTLITERGNNSRAGITAQAGIEEARIKAANDNKAPAGYRWAAGGRLEAIPGGPAGDGKALTEDQAKSAGYALRMDNALKLIGDIGKTNPGALRPGALEAATNALPETLANTLRPEARQRVEAAQLDALDAALTLNTGAAYTREQLQGLSRSYFAQPGDDDKTVTDKANRLQSLIDTARLRAGDKGSAMADAAQAKNAARAGGALGAASTNVPAGMSRQVGTSGGRPVYEDAQGNRFIGG